MALSTDDFNRTDNTVLGVNWSNRKGGDTSYGISTNRASIGLNQDTTSFYNATVFGTDQYSQVALSGLSGTNNETGLGVCVRCDTTNLGGGTAYNNWYHAVVNTAGSNNVSVAKVVADTYTLLAQRTQAWSDGDILRLEAQGSTLRVYRNGVQLGASITDSSVTTGEPGLAHIASFATGFADNWEGGDISVAGPGGTSKMLLLGVG